MSKEKGNSSGNGSGNSNQGNGNNGGATGRAQTWEGGLKSNTLPTYQAPPPPPKDKK